MKAISKQEDISKLDDMMFELHQLNLLVGFVQTSLAEGPGVNNDKDVAHALYYIYNKQNEVHKKIMGCTMKNRQLTFTLDYEEEEQLTTVLHFLSPILESYTTEEIPFYGKRAEITIIA